MMQKVLVAAFAAFALSASASAGIAFPAASFHAAQSLSSVQHVTFWGDSFPYGYNWSVEKACTRYEPVETGRGVVMERVWVCGDRARYSRR